MSIIKHLMAVVVSVSIASSLTSCKEEKRIVGTWEWEKTQLVEETRNHPIVERNIARDTTIYPEKGESIILTFTKKGVVLIQETDTNGNSESESYSYMIMDNKLYVEDAEFAMSFNGKKMILTSESTRDRTNYWDSEGNILPKEEQKKYQEYSKEVMTLKER